MFLWHQERRIAQQREVLEKEKETAEKIAARAYTQQYLANTMPAVFASLRTQGYFFDSVAKGHWYSAFFSPPIAAALSALLHVLINEAADVGLIICLCNLCAVLISRYWD